MAQNFGSESTQGSILLTYSTLSSAAVTVKDSAGKTLISYTPEKQYSCVVVSAPTLQKGGTYTVEAAGQSTSVTLSSLIYGSGSGMGGGRPGGIGGRPGGMGGYPGRM